MTDSPKIILNDDYIDLRSSIGKKKDSHHSKVHSKHPSLVNEGVKPEKELLLKDLVQNYNSYLNRSHYGRKKKDATAHDPRFRKSIQPQENGKHFNSHSEVSLLPKVDYKAPSPSTPHIIRPPPKKLDVIEDAEVEISNNSANLENVDSQEVSENPNSVKYSGGNSNIKDPRLLKKYSVLKMPWKRTWTLPVITKKSTNFPDPYGDSVDRQTYKYDDGTEIDSLFMPPKVAQNRKAMPTKLMMSLFLLGSGCGILCAAMLVNFIFTNETIKTVMKPKSPHGFLKKSYRILSGNILYVISSVLKTIGNVLTMPTHQVYQSPTEQNQIWT